MCTSPIGFFHHKESDGLKAAKTYAQVTHNHPEGIRGTKATSLCIFLARQGASKEEIQMD
jgi:ADP-ribosylglycohydrolase